MNYLNGDDFDSLSLYELLKAREQFHVHLMHKRNVIGTAIGRYLIRKTEPYPGHEDEQPRQEPQTYPRTLQNSEVRPDSLPCVLVFVDKWVDKNKFGAEGGIPPSDYVPPAIYLDDGRTVPICVVEAPYVMSARPISEDEFIFPDTQLSGGYPVIAEVQGERHRASIGCLVTDGHTIYALTNRHVAGVPGERLRTTLKGREIEIGSASDKQLGRLPFEKIYEGWPGHHVFVNFDVGLIRLDNQTGWNPAVYGIGTLNGLADLSIFNMTLKLIGCPVRAHGCVSGPLSGQISALFYRYKSMGGFEYVADFLIGSRSVEPLQTRPGDSGTVWVLESTDVREDRMAIAVQWGGTVFATGAASLPFALATSLSNICRELDVDLFRSRELTTFEYWGAVGHYTIGSLACDLVEDANLAALMLANRSLISFARGDLNPHVDDIPPDGVISLADVPDKVWKKPKKEQTPYGRRGLENPNHYADLDFPNPAGDTLDTLTPTLASLQPETWREYYRSVHWNLVSQRGLLPFRVWQIYKSMVNFVAQRDITGFVVAAGVLAHYIGDACQPLHGSYLDDGDPKRNPDGTPAAELLKHGTGYGNGVHHAYEDTMLDTHIDKLLIGLDAVLAQSQALPHVQGGQAAGFATIELMRRTGGHLRPIDIVNVYGQLVLDGKKPQAPNILWDAFHEQTITVIADGCLTLAMLWESAWIEGNGAQIPRNDLTAVGRQAARDRYENQGFLHSAALGQIDEFL